MTRCERDYGRAVGAGTPFHSSDDGEATRRGALLKLDLWCYAAIGRRGEDAAAAPVGDIAYALIADATIRCVPVLIPPF